jgi:hypothetical protein
MTDMTNDNHPYPAAGPTAEPDAHGQAAILLVESLIYGLVERSIISTSDAIGIVEAAAEVKVDMATDIGESPQTMLRSLNLLIGISDSLKIDQNGA